MMLGACSIVKVKPGAKVITIEPSAEALSMEETVKIFSVAFDLIKILLAMRRRCENCRSLPAFNSLNYSDRILLYWVL
jgi:hypothetical protein